MGRRTTRTSAFKGKEPPASAGRSRRGDEVCARILTEGLKAFGKRGFDGATTRRIAKAARVNLPARQYYFGGKEGLHRACSEEVVQRYLQHVGVPAGEALARLKGDLAPEGARALLKSVMRRAPGPNDEYHCVR